MNHKTALITGATSGIGEAYARQLAAQGYDLGLIGRRIDLLQALAAELIEKHKINAEAIPADLASEKGLSAIETWIETRSPISMLINNAGFGVHGNFHRTDTRRHVEMINVHVTASVRLMGKVLPSMIDAKRGAIINVSSPAAYLPLRGNSSYCATKIFLNHFSEAVALEVKPFGIKIQICLPGYTYSDFHKRDDYKTIDTYKIIPRWAWMDSESVAQISLRDLERGKLYSIPGVHNKIAVFLSTNSCTAPLVRWLAGTLRSPKGLAGEEI